MRVAWVAPGLMLATTAACGGVDKASTPTCEHGPNLVQTASSVIVAPADIAVSSGASALLSALVATTDGKTILATWTAVDSPGVATGRVVVAHLGPGGVVGTSAPVDAPALGVAAFDGTNFLVVGGPGAPDPAAPAPLQLERVAPDGSVAKAPQSIGAGFATSAVWTPRGLAIASWAENGTGAGAGGWRSAVQLFGDDGRLITGVALDGAARDAATGLWGSAAPAVALFRGTLVVAYGHTVSTLDWLGGSAQTSQLQFTVSVPIKDGFPTLFETGSQLRIWGSGEVYAGAPGGSFTAVEPIDQSAITQEPDGCGGAVTLSNRDTAIRVAPDTAPQRAVSLGTTLPTMHYVAAMTPTPTGFAVAWVADDGVHLATLAWQ